MDTKTLISRNKEITYSYLDGSVIMMNLKKGNYYQFNATGTRIWEILESGEQSMDSLVNQIITDFDVEKATALQDTIEFVEKSLEQDLIKIS